MRRTSESIPGMVAEIAVFVALIMTSFWAYGHAVPNDSTMPGLDVLVTAIWALGVYGAIIVFRLSFHPIASRDGLGVADRSVRYQLLFTLAWILAVPIAIWGFISFAIQWSGGRLPSLLAVDFRASVFLLGLTMFARPVVRTLIGRWIVRGEMFPRPFDGMVLSFLQCAYSIEASKQEWHVGSRSRYIISWIEVAARECERFPSVSRRVALIDRSARRAFTDIGYQISAVVRSHKIAIAQAGGEGDFSAASSSFCRALVDLSRGDVRQLCVNAGEVSGVSRLRAAVRRVGPSAALFVAAFAIP
ncbi:hypothetical protein [Kitasatospora paranensis]